MKRLSDFLVKKRLFLFIGSVIAAIICLFMISRVTVNEDMTEYLPEDSPMREGIEIMKKEFPDISEPQSFKLMFEGLKDEEKETVASVIYGFEGVSSVYHEAEGDKYNSGEYSLFVVDTQLTDSESADILFSEITDTLSKEYKLFSYYANSDNSILGLLLPIALTLFLLVLIILCKSYIEVLLLLASIGFSIILNTGTNVIFPCVSDMTLSIAAVLQLVLSIDYSVMLFHRYEQERDVLKGKDNPQAMKNAIANSFRSLSGSAITTVVGLLVLLLMSFTIGTDMGLVMAKGILFSLICVFTVMPTLVLWCDGLLQKTSKAHLRSKRRSKKEVKSNA